MRNPLRRRSMSLPLAMAAAVAVSAIPAGAAVLVANFMRTDVTRNASCIVKEAGLDTGTVVSANTTGTTAGGNGVSLLNEAISVQAYAGDRTVATDVVRIKNVCAAPMTVKLVLEKGIAASTVEGNWVGLAEKIYLGKNVQPFDPATGAPAPAALGGMDFSLATDWDQAPLAVAAATTGTDGVFTDGSSTGTVIIPQNSFVQLAVVVDAGTDLVPSTTDFSTVHFTVAAA